jgi:predicted TIM-barrel fold metal-dependent hydrolase
VAAFNGRYIDAHGHIRPGGMRYSDILSNMDREGIDTLVIMEPPGSVWINKMSPSEYGLPEAFAKYPNRFVALYSGEAGSMLYTAAKTGKYTKEDEARFTTLLEDAMKSGSYRGFGEIGLRHFPPPGMPQTFDITVPGDHPWMFLMSDVAARYGVPIDVHMEATGETVQGLERLLAHNRNTTVIWDHAGWGNTGEATPELMRRLLRENPNLCTSIKFRKDTGVAGFLNTDGTLNDAWLAVVRDYPDRFMAGSDIKPGIWDNEFRYVKSHVEILSKLPPEIQSEVARENAIRIFHIS